MKNYKTNIYTKFGFCLLIAGGIFMISTFGKGTVPPIMIVVGSVPIVWGLLGLVLPGIVYRTKKARDDAFKEEAILIHADIVRCTRALHVMDSEQRGRYDYYTYYIVCQGVNPLTGAVAEFASEDLRFDPLETIQKLGLSSLPVYISKDDPLFYHVDVSCITDSE